MTKDEIELKLERLLGREVKVNDKIKHSSHHIEEIAGKKGILKDYDLGEDYEDIIALVEVVLVTGKKQINVRNEAMWMDARDIAGVS